MDLFMTRFEQIILKDWQPKQQPRLHRIVGIPAGCVQIVLCFSFVDGGIGVISQGIFESSFSDVLDYVEKNGYGKLEKDAYRFRQFICHCHEWPTETSLRAYLLARVYTTPQESSAVQKIIKTTR